MNRECRDDPTEYRSESAYRKLYAAGRAFYDEVFSKDSERPADAKLQAQIDELYMRKRQFYDQRRMYNKALTEEARNKHLTQELIAAANALPSLAPVPRGAHPVADSAAEAVLFLSDWHYGMEASNIWNRYNVDIFRQRLSELMDKTARYLRRHEPRTLHVVMLGDMCSGGIHATARIDSEELVCEQIMSVSEYIARMLAEFAKECPDVRFYATYGNHLRTIQDAKDSIHADNSERLIPWWLKQRLKDVDGVRVIESDLYEFLLLNVCGHNVVATHGDLDTKASFADTARALFMRQYKEHIGYVVMGHFHHAYSMDDLGTETLVVGSMMGTDEFANNKRLYATPSQTLLIFTPESGKECRYDITFRT